MDRKYKKREPRIIRPEFVPECPLCGKNNTVGWVLTYAPPQRHIKAFYCSNCLVEFIGKDIIPPLYA